MSNNSIHVTRAHKTLHTHRNESIGKTDPSEGGSEVRSLRGVIIVAVVSIMPKLTKMSGAGRGEEGHEGALCTPDATSGESTIISE